MERPTVGSNNGGSGEATVNFDDLPDGIVQPLARLGSALNEHARAHRDHSLAEHEEGVLVAWRAAAPTLLEAVLQVSTTGLEPQARPVSGRCPGCQQRRSVQSRPHASGADSAEP